MWVRSDMLLRTGLLLGALWLATPASGSAQDAAVAGATPSAPLSAVAPAVSSEYFFYHPEIEYGSAARFGPTNVVLNRGFSTLVWQQTERRPLHIHWAAGAKNVWGVLSNPKGAIDRRGGFGVWLHDELGPRSWDPWGWMFASNWAGHTVAGGITYRMLSEWYQYHDVPAPQAFAAATVMGSILINETIEGQQGGPGSPSTVADVYVFEPLGIGLFSIDAVAKFFSVYLHADDWSPQATVTLPDLQLENVAQVVSYHIPLPIVQRLDFLVLIGQGSQMGLLYDLDPS